MTHTIFIVLFVLYLTGSYDRRAAAPRLPRAAQSADLSGWWSVNQAPPNTPKPAPSAGWGARLMIVIGSIAIWALLAVGLIG